MVSRSLKFDDLDDSEGAVSMTLAVDGKSWSLDLCPKNRAQFDALLKPYIAAAQRHNRMTASLGESGSDSEPKAPGVDPSRAPPRGHHLHESYYDWR